MSGSEGENDNAHGADYEDELEDLSSDELISFFFLFLCLLAWLFELDRLICTSLIAWLIVMFAGIWSLLDCLNMID
jgi:hypothetical protein